MLILSIFRNINSKCIKIKPIGSYNVNIIQNKSFQNLFKSIENIKVCSKKHFSSKICLYSKLNQSRNPYIQHVTLRNFSTSSSRYSNFKKENSTVYYTVATGLLMFGLTFAAVPLYKIFCQVNFNLQNLQFENNTLFFYSSGFKLWGYNSRT